ncbi:hypothetical protein A3X38_12610 [Salmonella enterica subsp. enterica serovar Florida]|nr:hypothetical protein [Salmonella enterica subsp. enterica serovar Florida]EBY1952627.1 hypothetical protein [Salmonella enterica subsp. enterica serovar Sandiego]EEP1511923.1 hypothetical protein [Salmonella enterica]
MREHIAEAVKEVLDDYETNKKADPAHEETHFYNMEEEVNNIRKVIAFNDPNKEDIKELDHMVYLLRNRKIPELVSISEVQ